MDACAFGGASIKGIMVKEQSVMGELRAGSDIIFEREKKKRKRSRHRPTTAKLSYLV